MNLWGSVLGEQEEGINRGNRDDSMEARMEAISEARSGLVSCEDSILDRGDEGSRWRSWLARARYS